MKIQLRKNGFTLVELLVAVAIIVMLVAIAIPASRSLKSSYESTGTESIISAALANARSIAAKERRYAGVRFQKAWQADNDGPQYMIFIVHDVNATNLESGFRAVQGLKPIKLPDNIGVMDLRLRKDPADATNGLTVPIDATNGGNTEINTDDQIRDTTTFSIIFSPAGKLIVHDVRVRNKDGTANASTASDDEIFNTWNNVTGANPSATPIGMFIQDDYVALALGLGQQLSSSSFVIYDREKFKKAYKQGMAWTDYLGKTDSLGNFILPRIYINPYTGTMIGK